MHPIAKNLGEHRVLKWQNTIFLGVTVLLFCAWPAMGLKGSLVSSPIIKFEVEEQKLMSALTSQGCQGEADTIRIGVCTES
jgi:hypothetical protein